MKKPHSFGLVAILILLSVPAFASVEPGARQQEYEQSVEGVVVRHKRYYKAGSLEVTATAGVMPYDSLVNHVLFGGRLGWHLTDHWGWEVANVQLAIPTITSFATDTVNQNGISNLQTTQLKLLASSNLLVSPLYGKIRFFGRMVLYYDIYVVVGGGMASVDVLQFSSPSKGTAGVQTTLSSGMNPMFDFGFGFKIFLNRAMGLVIDLRDYVVSAKTYGNSSLGSNYAVTAGLSFFLPPL